MIVPGYTHFGGRNGEVAAMRNLLAFHGVKHPATCQPLTEALCFAVSGGLGAGYSFCPSVPRSGAGSGVCLPGRHLSYDTAGQWQQGFFDRLGIQTRVTETAAPGKAFKNLTDELADGRPVIVWCAKGQLPFLGNAKVTCNLSMHSFIVFGVDEARQLALGSDRHPTVVTLPLADLAEARAGVCSHQHRTMTITPTAKLTEAALKSAIVAGLRACATGLLAGKMQTFSLPGLELFAKMLVNRTNQNGWLKVFARRFLAAALQDVFASIETESTGGGWFRPMFAEGLDEAALLLKNESLAALAAEYRDLGRQWTALAEATLPDSVKGFAKAKELARKKCQLIEEQGAPALSAILATTAALTKLDADLDRKFPLSPADSTALLGSLRDRVQSLHAAETKAALALQAAMK